jgi:hypothetical protein
LLVSANVTEEIDRVFWRLWPASAKNTGRVAEKYATDDEWLFILPGELKLSSIFGHGNVNEIVERFGGTDELRWAVEQFQTLLYMA